MFLGFLTVNIQQQIRQWMERDFGFSISLVMQYLQ